AGLSVREAHVLLARTFDRSHGDIAGDDALRKTDGAPISRQRVERIEHEARRKLGLSASVAVAGHEAERAGRAAAPSGRGAAGPAEGLGRGPGSRLTCDTERAAPSVGAARSSRQVAAAPPCGPDRNGVFWLVLATLWTQGPP